MATASLALLKVTSANYFKISIKDSKEPIMDTSEHDFPQKEIIFSMVYLHHLTIAERCLKQGTSKIRLGIWVPTGEGHGYPLQDSCLENPHGQRRLAGYSPWARTELGTERLSLLGADTYSP